MLSSRGLNVYASRIVGFTVSDSPDSVLTTRALKDQHIAALERKHEDDVACSEIDTYHSDYLGAQDTFYVGKPCLCCTLVPLVLNNSQPSDLTADLGAPLIIRFE